MLRTLTLTLLLLYPQFSPASDCKLSAPEEFSAFFTKFSDEKKFDISRTVFPLLTLKWEYGIDKNGKDESAPVKTYVSKAQYSGGPRLSSHMKENGLTSRIKSASSTLVVVEVFEEASDWHTSYHFKRKGNCWFFYEYQDHSL